ncbi:MAG: seg [Parcubacteria group bacterium]|nr:seg [Parcubacteria group bacterium]
MEYQVPQFIEVEDKIFGPLTLKQFIYLAGGIGLCVVLILYLPLVLGIILALPVAAFSGALAFYRVNNKSFTDMLGAGFSFYSKDRLYLWKKEEKSEEAKTVAPVTPLPAREKLGISSGRLKDLALSLDIKDQNNPQEPI